MRFGSLFAGIGGFDLGLERAGMECAWQVEIDEQCQETLARHWPDVERYSDVKEVKGDELGAVDLICGGFPCQDLSVAGKRAGLDGDRSGLWHEFRRIVEEARPAWVVVENVTGLLSSGEPRGADLAIILRGLAELGYMGAYRVLNAEHFGVAQRRRRVFIIGSLGNASAVEVLLEPEGLPGDPPTGEAQGEDLAATLRSRSSRDGVSAPGRGGEDDKNLVLAKSVRPKSGMERARNANLVAGTVTGAEAHNGNSNPIAENYVVNSLAPVRGGPDDNDAQAGHLVAGTLSDPTRQDLDGHGACITSHRMRAFGDYEQDDKASAMKARDHKDATDLIAGPVAGGAYGTGRRTEDDPNTVIQQGVRRLTPTECERLQGFPDGWTEGHADTPRYRMLGNAVCVPVAEWIGKRIMWEGDE